MVCLKRNVAEGELEVIRELAVAGAALLLGVVLVATDATAQIQKNQQRGQGSNTYQLAPAPGGARPSVGTGSVNNPPANNGLNFGNRDPNAGNNIGFSGPFVGRNGSPT